MRLGYKPTLPPPPVVPEPRFNEAEAHAPRIRVQTNYFVGVHERASMRPRRMRLGYRFPYNILFAKAISRCFRAVAFHGG